MREKSDPSLTELIYAEFAFKKAFLSNKLVLFNLIRLYQKIKVEHYKDFIFDKGNGLNGDVNAAFNFMREVELKNIIFKIDEKSSTFKMIDSTTNKEIVCSNRPSENGELRGNFLREKLAVQLEINPNLTVYDAIQKIISSQDFTFSRDFEYFLNAYQDYPEFTGVIKDVAADLAKNYQDTPRLSNRKMSQILEESYKRHMLTLRTGFVSDASSEYEELILAKMRSADLPHFNADEEDFYEELRDILRKNIDKQYGVFSERDANGLLIRDATLAFPLDNLISTNIVGSNTALLRCLSRTQAIDKAMEKKTNSENIELITNIRKEMKEEFLNLTEKILNNPGENKEETRQLEIEFNTFLINCLHDANLTGGCRTKKEAENLLAEFSKETISSNNYQYYTYTSTEEHLYLDKELNRSHSLAYKDLSGFNEVQDVEYLKGSGRINLQEEYQYNYSTYQQTILNYEPKNVIEEKLHREAKKILIEVTKIKNEGDFESLAELNAVLYYCKNTLEDPKNSNNLTRISYFAEKFSNKGAVFSALVNSLLLFSCLALAVLGMVAAIPTYGASLTLTGAAIILALDVPEITIPSNNLSSSLSDFKKIMKQVKESNVPSIDERKESEDKGMSSPRN